MPGMDIVTSQGKEAGPSAASGPQHIPVNLYETNGALVVVAAMPAVKAEDVSVEVSDTMVRLTADLRTAAPKEYLLQEWAYGGYERDLVLPDGFNGPVTASLGNGQLAVRIERNGAREGGATVVQPTDAGPDHDATGSDS